MRAFFIKSMAALTVILVFTRIGQARPGGEKVIKIGSSRFKIDPNEIYILHKKNPSRQSLPQKELLSRKSGAEAAAPTGPAGWVSLEQAFAINEALQDAEEDDRRPITVTGSDTSLQNNFRSNIPLPSNPFISKTPSVSPSSVYSHLPEELLASGVKSSYNSRSDVFSQIARTKAAAASHHYTKPGSSENFRGSYIIPAESRRSTIRNKDTFASILSELKRVEEIKETFPPHGLYTPYGERQIVMIKYPGLPERKRYGGSLNIPELLSGPVGPFGQEIFKIGGIKPISLSQDDWSLPSSRPVKVKDADFGVIISQNYILLPEYSVNSHYNYDEQLESNVNPGELIADLARALVERNNAIKSQKKYESSHAPPPFVLIHLETFTKKRNKTSPFGFDEDIETSYANGTIIYPTLHDPDVLASTKFEFESVADIEGVFNRPYFAKQNGGSGARPIVPLALVDVQNYLRLMYDVHRDIHEGGKVKVGELKGLSYVVDTQRLPGSIGSGTELKGERWRDNWLHTSTIGLRSLSDYSPPPPKLPIPYPI